MTLKAHEAECEALKDEFKARGIVTAAGEHFTVTRSDQVSSRLDVAAVEAFLGDACRKFEMAGIRRSDGASGLQTWPESGRNLQFPVAGDYQIRLAVDGAEVLVNTLHVMKPPPIA